MAQISAQSGDRKVMILYSLKKLPAAGGGHLSGGRLPAGGIDLNAPGLIQRGVHIGAEGIQHDANGKWIHIPYTPVTINLSLRYGNQP